MTMIKRLTTLTALRRTELDGTGSILPSRLAIACGAAAGGDEGAWQYADPNGNEAGGRVVRSDKSARPMAKMGQTRSFDAASFVSGIARAVRRCCVSSQPHATKRRRASYARGESKIQFKSHRFCHRSAVMQSGRQKMKR
jgi:hypothetical protein